MVIDHGGEVGEMHRNGVPEPDHTVIASEEQVHYPLGRPTLVLEQAGERRGDPARARECSHGLRYARLRQRAQVAPFVHVDRVLVREVELQFTQHVLWSGGLGEGVLVGCSRSPIDGARVDGLPLIAYLQLMLIQNRDVRPAKNPRWRRRG